MKEQLRKYHKQYLGNYHDRTMTMTAGSFAVNAAIGAGKLILGIIFSSPWFILTAVYYLLLCAARGNVLWKSKRIAVIEDPIKRLDRQFSAYRHSGAFIGLIGVSYLFVCLRMYFIGESALYPYYIIFGVAAVAFYKISMAIYGIGVTRRINNPILSSIKMIGLVDACVSIVAVQCALLTMENAASPTTSSALLGMACSVLFVSLGLFMLCKKKNYPTQAL